MELENLRASMAYGEVTIPYVTCRAGSLRRSAFSRARPLALALEFVVDLLTAQRHQDVCPSLR
jgi:hypothetical protein